MSSNNIADQFSHLPVNLFSLLVLAGIAWGLGYLAYGIARGRFFTLSEPSVAAGVGFAAGGGAIAAAVFAVILLWAIAVPLLVLALFGWLIANS